MSYDMIDRFLRNNLDDDDYAEYSLALDQIASPQPPQREWVGLTDEEIKACAKGGRSIGISFHDAICRAEAKLKEKNT